MADLHKFTVQEALNTDTAGTWEVGAASTAGSSAANTVHGTDAKDISGFHTVGIYMAADIYIRFTGSTTDACATTDILLPAGTHFIKIPHGINTGSGVYFNYLRFGSSDVTVNVVLI